MNYTLTGLKKLSTGLLFLPRIVGKFILWLVLAEISVLIQIFCTPKMFLDWLGGDPNLQGEEYDPKIMSRVSKFDREFKRRVGKRFSFITYFKDYLDEGSLRIATASFIVPLIVFIILVICVK